MNQCFCAMEDCLRECEYTVRLEGKEGYGRSMPICAKHAKSLMKTLAKGERLVMTIVDSFKKATYHCEAYVPSDPCPNPAFFEYVTMQEYEGQIVTARNVPTKLCQDHLKALVPVVPFGYIAQVRRLPIPA